MNASDKIATAERAGIGQLLLMVWGQADRQLRLRVLATVVLTIMMALLNSTAPLIFKSIVDRFAADVQLGLSSFLTITIGEYIALVAAARLCAEARWAIYGGFEQGVQRRLYLFLFDHVHGLSLRYHLERKTGALQQVIANGLLGYRTIIFNLIMTIAPLMFSFFVICTIFALFYPPIFVLLTTLMCILFISSLLIGVEKQRASQRTGNRAFQEAFARTTDSYLNFETIKLFGSEATVRRNLSAAVYRGETSFTNFYFLRTITGLIQSTWLTVWLAATLIVAVRYVMNGTMTIGDLVLVHAYALQLWIPLDVLGFAYREIRTGQTNIEQMILLLNEEKENLQPERAQPRAFYQSGLRFENVSFSYVPSRPILRGLTFTAPAGSTVAITGPSGAGKSTIARLLFRFYDACSGQILFNEVPIDAYPLTDIRNEVAIVPQEPVLFDDTIGFNIAISRNDCSQSEIESAAKIAEIHSFIESLPDGYGTLVGERGLKLSGGQKQRIAIARAILKRCSILVLDEATSALDNETEHAVLSNLRAVSNDKTILIITHRLSTIVDADQIVVVENGRVTEHGSHSELISSQGLYADMWRRQLKERRESKLVIEAPG
jgi:ATP-binding cassette, subfamily B, heavy metal transporter